MPVGWRGGWRVSHGGGEGSGERGGASRGAVPPPCGEARGHRRRPGAFPRGWRLAVPRREEGGRCSGARAGRRGAADRAFTPPPPPWGEPPPGRARGCRAAASWVARTKGPRRERAGSSAAAPVVPPPKTGAGVVVVRGGFTRFSPFSPRGQLLPRNLLGRFARSGVPGGTRGRGGGGGQSPSPPPPRVSRGCRARVERRGGGRRQPAASGS